MSKTHKNNLSITERNFRLSEDETLLNCNLCAAGGWVRDKICGNRPNDVDMIIKKEYMDEFLKFYDEKRLLEPWSNCLKQMTSLVLSKGTCKGLRLASFKVNGLRAQVRELHEGYTIAQDIQTRDFTVNSLYYDFLTGQLIDFDFYEKDVLEKRLRPTNSFSDTFLKDFGRFFRFVRLELSMNLKVEQHLVEALTNLMDQRIVNFFRNFEDDSEKRGKASAKINWVSQADYAKFFNNEYPSTLIKRMMFYRLESLFLPDPLLAKVVFEHLLTLLKKVEFFVHGRLSQPQVFEHDFTRMISRSYLFKSCHLLVFELEGVAEFSRGLDILYENQETIELMQQGINLAKGQDDLSDLLRKNHSKLEVVCGILAMQFDNFSSNDQIAAFIQNLGFEKKNVVQKAAEGFFQSVQKQNYIPMTVSQPNRDFRQTNSFDLINSVKNKNDALDMSRPEQLRARPVGDVYAQNQTPKSLNDMKTAGVATSGSYPQDFGKPAYSAPNVQRELINKDYKNSYLLTSDPVIQEPISNQPGTISSFFSHPFTQALGQQFVKSLMEGNKLDSNRKRVFDDRDSEKNKNFQKNITKPFILAAVPSKNSIPEKRAETPIKNLNSTNDPQRRTADIPKKPQPVPVNNQIQQNNPFLTQQSLKTDFHSTLPKSQGVQPTVSQKSPSIQQEAPKPSTTPAIPQSFQENTFYKPNGDKISIIYKNGVQESIQHETYRNPFNNSRKNQNTEQANKAISYKELQRIREQKEAALRLKNEAIRAKKNADKALEESERHREIMAQQVRQAQRERELAREHEEQAKRDLSRQKKMIENANQKMTKAINQVQSTKIVNHVHNVFKVNQSTNNMLVGNAKLHPKNLKTIDAVLNIQFGQQDQQHGKGLRRANGEGDKKRAKN